MRARGDEPAPCELIVDPFDRREDDGRSVREERRQAVLNVLCQR